MERIRIGTTVVRLTGVMMGGTLAMFTEGGAKCEHGSWMSRSGVRRAIQHMLLNRKKIRTIRCDLNWCIGNFKMGTSCIVRRKFWRNALDDVLRCMGGTVENVPAKEIAGWEKL